MSIYTKEQIARADDTDLVAYAKSRGIELVPKGKRFHLRDQESVYLEGNHWYSYYLKRGGGAVSFLTEIEGIRFPEAVRTLTGEEPMGTEAPVPVAPPPKDESRKLLLPLPADNNKAVYAYLRRRGISPSLIRSCLDAGTIYQTNMFWAKQEDGSYLETASGPQAVFLGSDPNGIPRYACTRSTTGDAKHDAPGSEKAYAFSLPAEGSKSVWVFESPIDLLSHATLSSYAKEPPKVHRISLGGVSPHALLQYLSDHPDILFVNLALDTDAPGREAVHRITEQLQGIRKVYDHPPKYGKDLNDELLEIQKRYREKHPVKEPNEKTPSL